MSRARAVRALAAFLAIGTLLLACSSEAGDAWRALEEGCLESPSESGACRRELRACVAAGDGCLAALEEELARRLEGPAGDPWLHVVEGQLRHYLGDFAAERRAYRAALARAEEQKHLPLAARSAYLLGASSEEHGEALSYLNDSLAAAERAGMAKDARYALNAMARRQRLLHAYGDERRTRVELARRQPADPGLREVRTNALAIADLDRRLGDFDKAAEGYRRVIEAQAKESGSDDELAILARMGLAALELDEGQAPEAQRAFSEAAERARAAGLEQRALEAAVLAAASLLRAGEVARAEEQLLALEPDASRASELAAAQVQIYLAECARRSGRVDEAQRRFREAYELAKAKESEELLWESLAGLATALRDAGDVDEARARAREAVALIESVRSDPSLEGDRLHFLHLRADAYATLAVTSSMRGDHEDAYRALELAHARALRETSALASPGEASSAEGGGQLRRLRARMPEGTLILAYQLGEPDSLLLAIEAGGVSAHLLPSRHVLAPLVDELLAHLRAPERLVALPGTPPPDPSHVEGRASRLAELLLEPASAKLARARQVLVVADRALHRLPFEVLPLSGEGQPLGLARPLSYLAAPSFFALPASRDIERVVLLKALEGAPLEGLPPLQHGQAESEAVRASYERAEVDLIEAAQQPVDETLSGLSQSADVLHVIAHARLSALEGPQIVLRAGRTLDARAIAATALDVDLVVLSACESGGGEILGGEGVLGLVRAFRMKGAEAIVASLWPVDDASTAVLMGRFHAELAAGRPPSEALLRARRELVVEAGVEHPYFWAPFVLYGSR